MNKFVKTPRESVRAYTEKDNIERLSKLCESIESEGYTIEFGHIGKKTTYCLLSKGDEEILGYTFIRNLKYSNELVGKIKAIQQAIARKEITENTTASED